MQHIFLVARAFFLRYLVPMDAKQIIQRAGGFGAVACRFDVSLANVRNQANAGRLPAAWYFALVEMIGEDLPRHLFSFKGLSQ